MRQIAIVLLLALAAAGCPPAGGVEIMPLDDQRVRVNDTLILDLRVRTGVGGEQWTFSAPSLPDINASLSPFGPSATFRWSPLASHAGMHQLTFTVTAGTASDSETINVEVIQAGGAPRFIQPPAGGSFDLGRNPEVVVPIQVVDEDSTSVEIREREPRIEGGGILTLGAFSAEWRWSPSPAQVDRTLSYTLRLEAWDGSRSVPHDFSIVLLTEGRENCPGAPPEISSVTPPVGDPVATVRDYEVVATITDDQGFKDAPVLFYSADQPSDPSRPDLTAMKSVPFLPLGGGRYHAFVPNFRPGVGVVATVYYLVRATDNDDPDGAACDHSSQSPLGQFRVTDPDYPDRAGYCDVCSNDSQCDGGLCVTGETYGRCGTNCGGGCPTDSECREVTSRDGSVDRQCVPLLGRDCAGGGGECAPDGYEPANDTMASAPTLAVGSVLEGTICPGDYDYYAVTLAAGQRYEVTVTGWDPTLTDVDLELLDPTGWPIGFGYGTSGTESFELCADAAGRHHVLVYCYDETDQGDYLLEVAAVAGSCCEDDWYEDNDSRAAAERMTCGLGVEAAICEGDEDWFSFSITAASTVEVDMACDWGSGDLDLWVYDGTGALLGSDLSGSCDSSIRVSLPAPGTYYVRVKGYGAAEGQYMLDCSVSAGASCSSSSACPSGRVCSPSGCIDDACDDPGAPGECPSGHFCPEPGGTAWDSDCADTCTSSTTCRGGYACKIFDEGRGCALAGTGQTGQPCGSFRDCAGERTCLTAGSTGYCAEINCTSNLDCPTDDHTGLSRPARCVDVGGSRRVCLMDCLYGDRLCDINPGTCQATADVAGSAAWVCVLPGQTVPRAP